MKVLFALLATFCIYTAAYAENTTIAFSQDARLRVLRVQANINGRPVTLLFDTGATYSLISSELAGVPRQKLPAACHRKGPGIRVAGVRRAVDLDLGGRTWRERDMVVVDMKEFRKVYGEDVAGIVGQDLLSEFDRVEIDYRNGNIVLSDLSKHEVEKFTAAR